MIGIDTNVLVRYFTQDDEVQSKQASNLIEKFLGSPKSILINNIVLCELIWVLLRGYKYSKNDVLTLLKGIASTIEFTFEDINILMHSILEFEESNTDFADILIGNINNVKGVRDTFTFDIKASALSSFKYIGKQ